MKHFLFFAFFLFSFTVIHAQRLSNGMQLDTMPQITYIHLNCIGGGIGKDHIHYRVDCGIVSKLYKNITFMDEGKKALEFKTDVALLNYLAGQGWELVAASTMDEVVISYNYWLKRIKK